MIVAGFGFNTAADAAALRAALAAAQEGVPPVEALAAPDDKHGLPGEIAALLGLPLITVDPAALIAASPVTRSPASLAVRGTGSVAEAAALAAAGQGARLLTLRHISPCRRATCAIAQGFRP
ncbi:cobalamin biosynthesis protein [Sphingomonas aerolata]|uniref:cobalamin biosynthesis protein n=1 Tax=Sphingomonas aerolata TaxID=185951 RepID=UPI003354B42B